MLKILADVVCKGGKISYRKSILLVVFSILVSVMASCSMLPDFGSGVRILFIGNSYTFTSNIPYIFSELAKSGGHTVETGTAADKGGSLADYVLSASIREKIQSSKWDFIVLQEQSQIPASQNLRTEKMYPAARELVQQIRADGATPIFFQTSANSDGWPENGLPGYENMQLEIIQGYAEIASELNVPIAPVGHAWFIARKNNPQLQLWLDDRHPNERGAYLAACIFYAAFFRESPENLAYMANIPKNIAQELQKIAADTVLHDPKRWNLL